MRDSLVYNTWSEEEIQVFLAERTTGRLGTIDPDGFPHVVPMWYVLLKGRVHFSTRVPRKKIGNIRDNPQISFTVDSGERFDEYQGILIQGRAEVVEDPDVLRTYQIAFAHRHCGSEDHPYVRILSAGKTRVVRLDPVNVYTWDYGAVAR